MLRIGGVISPAARLRAAPRSCKPIRTDAHAGDIRRIMATGALVCTAFTANELSFAAETVRCCGVAATLSSSLYDGTLSCPLHPDDHMRIFSETKRLGTLSLFLLAALFACGGSGSSSANGVTSPGPTTPPVNSSTTSLTVSNNKYTPAQDSVAVGATLTWSWNSCTGDGYGGSTCTSHSVTFDDGPTSPIQGSGSFSRTFASAGTYTYHCKVHGAAMAGTVLVK